MNLNFSIYTYTHTFTTIENMNKFKMMKLKNTVNFSVCVCIHCNCYFCIVYASCDVSSKFMSMLAYMHSQLYFFFICSVMHMYFSFKFFWV